MGEQGDVRASSEPSTSIAIDVSELGKHYAGRWVLDSVSLRVPRGQVYALLGPNGAGKSTTIEILEGHRARSRGRVSVLGCDPATGGPAFRDRIGIVLQSSGVEDQLTVREALDLYGSVYSRRRETDEVLDLVDLADAADARVKKLSGGQQRRIDLALGIIGCPEVLFLDEPTTGFDPVARHQAWTVIEALRDDGTTVLLTTHYMEEAQRLADRVGVIVAGRIVAEGSPAQLMDSSGETRISFRLPPGCDASELPVPGASITGDDVSYLSVSYLSADHTATLYELTAWATARGVPLDELTVTRPTLEDAYLALAHGLETQVVRR